MLSLQPFDIGCEPSPSVTSEILIQDGWSTFLVFFAVSQSVGETGFLTDKGVAVLECVNCGTTMFGGPDRSNWGRHPLWKFGLTALPTRVMQVVDSPWVHDFQKQYQDSSEEEQLAQAHEGKADNHPQVKHFVVLLNEMTFECLATDMGVKRFFKTHGAAFRYVRKEIAKH